ncbi:hypothetical protein TNCV_45621 [Trichonephila clavipes]|nr:hypothetical protein TNCV_45621 [Trichonephila clavipes]
MTRRPRVCYLDHQATTATFLSQRTGVVVVDVSFPKGRKERCLSLRQALRSGVRCSIRLATHGPEDRCNSKECQVHANQGRKMLTIADRRFPVGQGDWLYVKTQLTTNLEASIVFCLWQR